MTLRAAPPPPVGPRRPTAEDRERALEALEAKLREEDAGPLPEAWAHKRCPDRCHRCPALGGEILPGCYGVAVYGETSYCTCRPEPAPMPRGWPR